MIKAQFDDRASSIAQRYGYQYDELPWLDITFAVTLIYLILTMLTMWQRKDTLSITVCVCAIYVL